MEFTQVSGPECGVERGKRRGRPEPRAGRGRSWRGPHGAGPGPVGEERAPLRRGERTGGLPSGSAFRLPPGSRSGPEVASRGASPWLIASDASETRTLHPLAFPARLSDPGAAELRRGLYVDCETTGFSPEHDAVIELALLPFTYTLAGAVVEVLHDEAQAHRNDPGRSLPAEITHLTGLTDDDVRGERIDVEAASALIEGSGLIVAHNARFDRPFVERVLPAARARPWACTRAEVPWTAEGFASQALHCLLCAYGVFARDRHRALADCEAGVWLLAQRLPVSGDSVLAAMRRRALTATVRLWAIRAPFESKELLRARGYRWMPEMRDGIERSWWTDVEPDEVESELEWLREAVHARDVGVLAPRGDPPATRDRVRSLANGPERPGASRARRRGRPRPGCGVSPLAPASCRRRVPRGRDRGCAGGYRPTGWGCDLAARAILVRRIRVFPSIPGNFLGSRRSRYLVRGSPFRHGLNPLPAPTRFLARSLAQLEEWI